MPLRGIARRIVFMIRIMRMMVVMGMAMIVGVEMGMVMVVSVRVGMRVRVPMLMSMPMPMQPCADAFHVMMMAHLRLAHLMLEGRKLRAILAQGAVHGRIAGKNAARPLDEGLHHQRMIVQIGRLDDLDIRMGPCRFVRRGIDALHQNPGAQKLGKDDYAL